MKLALVSLLPAATLAFTVPHASTVVTTTTKSSSFALSATTNRPDASAAIDAALEASKKYGATSPEARVAWDAVEEMDASDNSVASVGSLDTECLIEEDDISKACLEYGDKLESLHRLLQENQPKIDEMKGLANEMKAIKMSVSQAQPAAKSPALDKALQDAKDAEAKFGKGSPEAVVAWSELEDIAASGLGNAMGPRLDEECLVDSAVEACQAIEELNKALSNQKST